MELEQAQVCAFGMTRRRDVAAEDDPALGELVACFAPVSRLVGKTWALHLEKVTRVSPEENLGDDPRLGRASARARASGSIYDAEHFFDAWRDDRAYALECLRGRGRGRRRERHALRHQRLEPAARRSPRRRPRSVAALGDRVAVGIHTHNDAECGVANSLAAVEAGATLVQGTINGYGERCGNANLVSILPALQLKLGLRRASPPERLRAADRDRALRRRALQPARRTPTSPTSAATPSPTRAACTSPGSRPTRARSSTSTRSWSATAARS